MDHFVGFFLQTLTQFGLILVQTCEVLCENISHEFGTYLLNSVVGDKTILWIFRVDHDMHVGMMPLVMKSTVPLEVFKRYFHG